MPSTPSILICDDETPIRLILSAKFRAAGFTVMEATTGREGLTAALTNPPDIIVTDFQMPEMDGVELCTRLRSNRASASVPAILLTARGHVLDDAHLRATNIRKVIDKPFSAREVVSAVESILRTKDQQSEGARDAA